MGTITRSTNQFNRIRINPDITPPPWMEGRVFYDRVNKTITLYNSEPDISLQIGQENYVYVYNGSGSTILNGKAVYINGANNGLPTIALADASSATAKWVVGLATHDIEDESAGFVTVFGIVRGLDTSGLSVGNVFLSNTSPGDVTNTEYNPPDSLFSVGDVIKSDDAAGCIFVHVLIARL
jgi:hypothetical protein